MIRKLSELQRFTLVMILEENNWLALRDMLRVHGKLEKSKCKCKETKKSIELCDYCVGWFDDIFNKIGWYNSTHWVIGVWKPKAMFKELKLRLRVWWTYSVLKKPRYKIKVMDK